MGDKTKESVTKPDPINEKTRRILNLLDEIMLASVQYDKPVGVGSGIALEILAANLRGDENLTRNHGDLDIHPYARNIPFWKQWFVSHGYIIGTNDEIVDKNVAFVAHSPDSTFNSRAPESCFYADVYGLIIDERGYVYSPESGTNEPWGKKWQEAFEDAVWHGHKVKVMNHLDALRNKRETANSMGAPLRDKDIHDHKLFGIDPIPK